MLTFLPEQQDTPDTRPAAVVHKLEGGTEIDVSLLAAGGHGGDNDTWELAHGKGRDASVQGNIAGGGPTASGTDRRLV